MKLLPPSPSLRQRGVALIVSLILLVLIALLGLAGMQNTSLQERLAGNMYDRSLAMQAAESALRAAEAAIAADPDIGVDCSDENITCDDVPENTFLSDSEGWFNVGSQFIVNQARAAGTPQYHIQRRITVPNEVELGQGSSANTAQYGGGEGGGLANIYRVTARSNEPTDGRAVVVLQTTLRRAI